MATERNYGIDLLRIISMFMIVILHCLGTGGILSATDFLSVNYNAAWLMEIMAYCAVNCYALISGYVGYDKKVRYANLFYLICQTVFYSVLITLLFFVTDSAGPSDIIRSFFPIPYNSYWYMTSYFCMFFFIPFLNKMLSELKQEDMKKLIYTLILIFSILPTVFYSDMASLKGGYSMLWLSALYLIGGYISKYKVWKTVKKRYFLIIYLISSAVTWLSFIVIAAVTNRIFLHPVPEMYLVSYTSVTILINAVCLLLFFSRLQLKGTIPLIRGFAPATLGVYLIHTHPMIFPAVMKNCFSGFAQYPVLQLCGAVLSVSMGICLICSVIDRLRLLLFDFMKVKEICILIENRLKFMLVYLSDKDK